MTGSVTSVVLFSLISVATDDSLFQVLDRNQDGVVSADEVSGTQQSWFQRAIRVADQNGDGQLNEDELEQALSDPQPRRTGGRGAGPGRKRGMARLTPQQLDRNQDGRITLDEVPQPAKKRVQQVLDRLGRDSISVAEATQYLQRNGRLSMDAPAMDGQKKADDNKQPQGGKQKKGRKRPGNAEPDPERMLKMFRRLDRNKDGKLTSQETSRMPRLQAFDRNGDGVIEQSELPSADRAGKGRRRKKQDGAAGERPTPDAQQMFRRLDKNGDGRLSRDEVPDRLRARFTRVDRDEDGVISPAEMEAAIRRRASQGRPAKQKKQ